MVSEIVVIVQRSAGVSHGNHGIETTLKLYLAASVGARIHTASHIVSVSKIA